MKRHPLQPAAVCVYCASSADVSPAIKEAGARAGRLLAEAGLDLVYGGTTCGLMKITADAHKAAGGRVIGIVPGFMVERGIAHPELDEVVAVPDMRTRKGTMIERSGAFLVLPGGIGTYDELFDTLALKQLGKHHKPIVLLNTGGYYEPLLAMLRHGVAEHTLKAGHLSLLGVAATPEEALELLAAGGGPPSFPPKIGEHD
ncbi:MAG: TIGR00730 family Rossman fold protein [Candidatus Riflebacteria bacterium]|nr:TIGR00730 family Rossman fold protein [Candidatus Riflebacteria bacterium]